MRFRTHKTHNDIYTHKHSRRMKSHESHTKGPVRNNKSVVDEREKKRGKNDTSRQDGIRKTL